ncbi:hypothetical protein AY599_23625 [Leptolyngbya valderiana BDU 20041]|nr:hypothetical protein AY599_23625 [Leptolyngbya valderiana BDU 20041]
MSDAPDRIIADECARHGVAVADMRGVRQRGAPLRARQAVAFRLWTETDMSADAVAAHIGRSDHAAASYAILGHARRIGRPAARISDLRGAPVADLDWTKLAFAAAGFRERAERTIAAAAATAGVGRAEWRKVEKGRAVGAGAMLRICRTIDLDPFLLVLSPGAPAASPPAGLRREGADARSRFEERSDGRGDQPISHEKAGKHDAHA